MILLLQKLLFSQRCSRKPGIRQTKIEKFEKMVCICNNIIALSFMLIPPEDG